MPVLKTVAPISQHDVTYNPDTHSLHTLFCGTSVVQCRAPRVFARVTRTAFATKKGDLVLSIMYAKQLR